jgi:hypothetical protein
MMTLSGIPFIIEEGRITSQIQSFLSLCILAKTTKLKRQLNYRQRVTSIITNPGSFMGLFFIIYFNNCLYAFGFHHPRISKTDTYKSKCVFGMAVGRIDFDRIEFERIDFG